jgi:hypothetical protein
MEGSRRLLECGAKQYRANDGDLVLALQKRINPLFVLFAPSVVVVKELSRAQEESRVKTVITVIRQAAAKRSIQLVFIRAWEVQNLFGQPGRHTRHAVASRIALLFPELAWKLPPARKPWQSEPHNLAVFDALALALAYRARYEDISLSLPRS